MSKRAIHLLAFQLRKAQSSRMDAKIIHPKSEESSTSPKHIVETFGAYFRDLYADWDNPSIRNEMRFLFFNNISTITEGGRYTWYDKTNNTAGSFENYKILKIINHQE